MKRAVIYCRTSTTEESQLNALENQVQEASACVKTQGWQLVDSYVESGSGTTTHGRDQYKRLYEDLLLDRFDIIVNQKPGPFDAECEGLVSVFGLSDPVWKAAVSLSGAEIL